jgi:glycosyltransferase involved in cell wall biosynthesis
MARVCMVAYTYYFTDSRIRREAEALVDRGDSVDVIALGKVGEERTRVLHGVTVMQPMVGRYRGASPGKYLINYCLFFIAAAARLAILHLRDPYHIVQVHTMPDFMVFAAIVPKLLGASVVLDVHDLVPELYRSKFRLPEKHWLIRFITWVERRSIGFADRAIAVNKPHLDALVHHGNPERKFIILLNLPDPKVFGPNRRLPHAGEECRFKMIYHGMVAERYGLGIVLQAIASLREEIRGLSLLVAGEGDGLPDLVELAGELGLSDCVEFIGFVPLEDLVPTLLDADVGVVPLLLDSFTKYVLPVKLLEYVALGTPAICARTQTIEEYFDDSMVQYFTPGDAGELANCIRLLYGDPEKRERLGANADRFNGEHAWEQEKHIYYEMVDGLVRE